MNQIRNVCILAHVDHGKTSLADVLISPSGVISQRSAGDLRFMDSTMDEQQRGITMKSSAISLRHEYQNKLKGSESEKKKYFINLVDSPGHVDFSGEVSTAVKISDNAFIVVDVVEGVCPQTRTVLQQAWKEDLNFVLILNKVDKLHSELKLTTTEAYAKLTEIIEDVHHLIGELISQDVKIEEEKTDSFMSKECISERYDTLPFHPLKGRVVFCSAFHHWGFRISDFVEVYSNLLGIDKQDLYKKMWGDFYLSSKKTIMKGALTNNKKNLFTSLILDQIWAVYNALESSDIDRVVSMMSKLSIKVSPRKNVNESSHILNIRHVLNSWMPICTTLLDTLIEKCPDPRSAMTDKKLRVLVPNDKFSRAREILRLAETTADAPMVIFISKVMLQEQNDHEETISKELIAFGRVYSGYVRPSMKVFLFSPRFNPDRVCNKYLQSTATDFSEGPINLYEEAEDDLDRTGSKFSDAYVFEVRKVLLFVGQSTLLMEQGAPAGYVIGLSGLDWHAVHKSAVAVGNCALGDCLGLFSQYDSVDREGDNIICVSVEPKKIAFLNELQEGLQLLEKADPIVDVKMCPTGEMLIYAAGEIHLQKCLKDLQTRIVPHIELDISPPIVPFRETVIHRSKCDPDLFSAMEALSLELQEVKATVIVPEVAPGAEAGQQGLSEAVCTFIRLPQKCGTRLCVRVSVHSLPRSLANWIDEHGTRLSRITRALKRQEALSARDAEERTHLQSSLQAALKEASEEETALCSQAPSPLVSPIDYQAMFHQFQSIGDSPATVRNMIFSYVGGGGGRGPLSSGQHEAEVDEEGPVGHAVLKGAQRALQGGPLCQEPMRDVVVVVHALWETAEEDSGTTDHQKEDQGDLVSNGGQMGNAVSRGVLAAVLLHPGARLMIATYKLQLEIRIPMFKNLSAIIRQLHGTIDRQEVQLGSFLVEAALPVVESFGFGDKLRKGTSGEVALPQLRTVEWAVLPCPPLMDLKMHARLSDRAEGCDLGIPVEAVARTRAYLTAVRLRKGLQTREQIVESGDKQRTLSRKK